MEGYDSLLTAAPELWKRRKAVNDSYKRLSKRVPKRPALKDRPQEGAEQMPDDKDDEDPQPDGQDERD